MHLVAAGGLLQGPVDLLHPTLQLFLAETQEIQVLHFQALDPSLNQAQPHSSRKHPHRIDPEHDAHSFIRFVFQPTELLEDV